MKSLYLLSAVLVFGVVQSSYSWDNMMNYKAKMYLGNTSTNQLYNKLADKWRIASISKKTANQLLQHHVADPDAKFYYDKVITPIMKS